MVTGYLRAAAESQPGSAETVAVWDAPVPDTASVAAECGARAYAASYIAGAAKEKATFPVPSAKAIPPSGVALALTPLVVRASENAWAADALAKVSVSARPSGPAV
jgi:hypothetical protein